MFFSPSKLSTLSQYMNKDKERTGPKQAFFAANCNHRSIQYSISVYEKRQTKQPVPGIKMLMI